MAEVLTGKQLRDRADACLSQRKPDKETLRNWIGRGADRIDKLTQKVDRLESDLQSGGSEATLMMLEDARKAADNTLDRIHKMEAATETALDDARAAAEIAAGDVIIEAGAKAAEIVASAREAAEQQLKDAEAQCQALLDSAAAQIDNVDEGCRNLVSHANALDGAYRKRIADIRTEANALVTLMERFDTLPISTDYDTLDSSAVVQDMVAGIDEFKASANPDSVTGKRAKPTD